MLVGAIAPVTIFEKPELRDLIDSVLRKCVSKVAWLGSRLEWLIWALIGLHLAIGLPTMWLIYKIAKRIGAFG